jgi:haloacetate dehalogenase
MLFKGFTSRTVAGDGADIHLRLGGAGPPLLLLHGYPQTSAMWHKVAPGLAERFTVVAADLRGYGGSSKPASDPDHVTYSKRMMARDMVQVMAELGFGAFAVAGHDRGGRVGYRMALDHPAVVARLAVLDIVPTHVMWQRMDKDFAMATYHWLFLAQPDGLPETLIGADPPWWVREKLRRWAGDPAAFAPEAVAEYVRCFSDPAAIHASCEDYRAGAGIDDQLDAADRGRRRIACPVLVLWGGDGIARRADDPLAAWRPWCDDVRGRGVPGGHFVAEESPTETLEQLVGFLGDPVSRAAPRASP